MIHFREKKGDKTKYLNIFNGLQKDSSEKYKNDESCGYHSNTKFSDRCLMKSQYIYLEVLNNSLQYPYGKERKQVMMYNKDSHDEMLKQWVPNVPVYFITTENGINMVMMKKNNIYDCQNTEIQEWNIADTNKQYLKTIGEYLKSQNDKAIVIVHDSVKENVNSMKQKLSYIQFAMPQTIVISLHDFMRFILSVHGKEFNLIEFNKQMNEKELENGYNPCDNHQDKPLECGRNLLLKWYTIIQTTMKNMQIGLSNINDLMKFKQQMVAIQPINLMKQKNAQQNQFDPIGKTFMFVDFSKEQDEIIEVGCMLFKHDQTNSKNQFQKISNPQFFYCKPKNMKDGLEDFQNSASIEKVVEHIYNEFFKTNTFDYVIYSNKTIKNYFSKYVMNQWVEKTIDDLKKKIVQKKLKMKVKNITKQCHYVWKKLDSHTTFNCPFHEKNPLKCVCSRIYNDIDVLNYFNDNLFEIQNECPFVSARSKQRNRLQRKQRRRQNNDVSYEILQPVSVSETTNDDTTNEETMEDTSEMSYEINDQNGMQCSVCTTWTKDMRMTNCGHAICEECYQSWFINYNQTICPVCNAHNEKTEVFKLYL